MNIIEISSINDPRIEVFGSLSDAQLRNRYEAENGIFIAESPKVITAALDAGHKAVSLLCERRHITGDAAQILDRLPEDFPVFTGTREVLANLTGYTLTRGVLCAMERPTEIQMEASRKAILTGKRIAVIDGVCDTTNIGSIFRAAAALGIDGIVLTRSSCDPLNRRSIRVSMGTVFKIKWCWLDEPISSLRQFGFKTLAMALKPHSIALNDHKLKLEDKLAIILGTEGDGLSNNVIDDADFPVIIPMHSDVDSLNVASAAAVAFWELCKPVEKA